MQGVARWPSTIVVREADERVVQPSPLQTGKQSPQRGAAVTTDLEKRQAIEQHWAASEAGDSETEHRLYAEDAILDYPQSGERFVGRSTIAEQRGGNPADRHFRLRRVLGSGSVWVSECVITYDGAPTNSVSIMEFNDGFVAHETQYFADPFEAPAARAQLAKRMDSGS
jgi:hypothetical protein